MVIELSKLGGSDRFTVDGEMEVEIITDALNGVFVIDAFDSDGDSIELSLHESLDIENAIDDFLRDEL